MAGKKVQSAKCKVQSSRVESGELPAGWIQCTIGDTCDINPKVTLQDHLDVGFLPMSGVPKDYQGRAQFEVKKWNDVKKGYTQFMDGDTLFAKVTPCFENGKATVISGLPNKYGAGSTELFVLRPRSFVYSKYLLGIIKTKEFMRSGAVNMTGSVGLKRVPKEFVETFPIPLAPLPEQKVIADKLDALLAQVDSLKARLDAIPVVLKRFRQSVLSAAVSGKLTDDWRTNKEASSRNKALESRRLKWEEAERQTRTASGKIDHMEKWKGRYKEPLPVNYESCFEIPKNWEWSNLSEICWSVKDGPHFSPNYTDKGIPFISGGNIRAEGIDFTDAKQISEELHTELSKRCKPAVGDILYTKGGTTGIAYYNTESREFNVWVHVAVLKLAYGINGKFIQHALNSSHCYDQSQKYTHGVGNQDLGLTRLVNITIPLPPLPEQTEIVRRVEQLFAFADQVEARVKAAQSRTQHLTQAILAKAFRGELTAEWRNEHGVAHEVG